MRLQNVTESEHRNLLTLAFCFTFMLGSKVSSAETSLAFDKLNESYQLADKAMFDLLGREVSLPLLWPWQTPLLSPFSGLPFV